MDGLTAVATAPVREGSRAGVAVHVASTAGMLALMAPAMVVGHASLAGIGATFAFFAWAAVAARWGRGSGRVLADGAVGDPFAMGLLMAAPFLTVGMGGHGGHGAGAATVVPDAGLIIGALVLIGWTLLRARSLRAAWQERVGFWTCLLMMVAMLVAMSIPT